MGRKELPQALTLARFAAGKDGRANAFKKKKQANKRKLFEKAQLKRQYSKLVKAEAAIGEHGASPRTEKAQLGGSTQAVNEEKSKHATFPSKLEREEGAHAGHIKQTGSSDGDGHSKRARNQFIAKIGGDKSGEKRRRQRRPDPFKEAKAIAEQRRKEVEDQEREKSRLKVEKEQRAKKRRKQHVMLSKRTKGGQPVMKHTMQHLLEKIQSQT